VRIAHGYFFFVEREGERVLIGKRFRLTRPTVGIHLINGARSVVTLPANAIIEILPGPDANGKVSDSGVVYARWEDRSIAMFIVDLEQRGIEVAEDHHSAMGNG
jgi:hypothetical protein